MTRLANDYRSLIASLDRRVSFETEEEFWGLADLFEIMDAAFLNSWATATLEKVCVEPSNAPYHDRGGIVIHATQRYTISLTLLSYVPEYLYWYPQHYFAKNVGRRGVQVHRYSLSTPVDNNVFDANVQLNDDGVHLLKPGAVLTRNGRREIIDWGMPQERGLILRLHAIGNGPFEWVFGRESKKSVGLTAIDPIASQIVSLVRMLSVLNAPDDEALIENCLTSRYFHVRWEALRALNALNPEAARRALRRLANDPHPSIRKAVEKTLALNA